MNVKSTYKDCLLNYPSIFQDPLAVSIHLFSVIGNGYEWKDGELVSCHGERGDSKMRYDDLDEKIKKSKADAKNPCLRDLCNGYVLRDEAEKLKRKFVEENIKTILASPCDFTFFRNDYEVGGSYITDCISVEYARGLHFPDDIKEDWKRALNEFLGWWLVRLNQYHRLGNGDLKKMRDHWPETALKDFNVIAEARKRLDTL